MHIFYIGFTVVCLFVYTCIRMTKYTLGHKIVSIQIKQAKGAKYIYIYTHAHVCYLVFVLFLRLDQKFQRPQLRSRNTVIVTKHEE
jgi:hypothetical protein